jgi:UDP-2,4-diacetamido-2,4,6-trideoxy-beta-L-altropyranose hydrolase
VNILIRVDASRQIGTGHFVRCLALADALRTWGGRTCFICRHLPKALAETLVSQGHELIRIDSSTAVSPPGSGDTYSEWLGVAQEEDASQTLAALGGRSCDWLVVDHYALDYLWERKMRTAVRHVLVLDDLADRSHECDVLVDQNFYEDADSRYVGKVSDGCITLVGPKYAILREEFRRARREAQPRTGVVRDIFVFLGGTDAMNCTTPVVRALRQLALGAVQVDVVIGAEHPHLNEIKTLCKSDGFRLHIQTSRMAELMLAADLAIGAGGSANWERCCLGLPCLAISIADNQDRLVRDSARAGVLYAPSVSPTDADALAHHIRSLMENPLLLESHSLNSMKLVDGRGVQRILRVMGARPVNVRPARSNDAAHLFQWRNHPSIRQVSRTTDLIDWAAHQLWLASTLENLDRVLLIGEVATRPIGVVRFDVTGNCAEISIYLVPGQEQRGLGTDLLLAAEEWFRRSRPDVRHLQAEVLGENMPARKLFATACYHTVSTHFTKRMD